MSITAITIENFKGIREPVRVELKPITLLFGPNSAGKSTIVQALHYAREIFERQNLNPDKTLLGGASIDLGGFKSLVHNHDTSRPIRIGFELDLSQEDLPTYTDGEVMFVGTDRLDNDDSSYLLDAVARIDNVSVEVTIRWSEQFTRPYLADYSVSANGKDLISIESSSDEKQIHISKMALLKFEWVN
jgi:energy-coupling factor transporter ATP-binding protein EcfA2